MWVYKNKLVIFDIYSTDVPIDINIYKIIKNYDKNNIFLILIVFSINQTVFTETERINKEK